MKHNTALNHTALVVLVVGHAYSPDRWMPNTNSPSFGDLALQLLANLFNSFPIVKVPKYGLSLVPSPGAPSRLSSISTGFGMVRFSSKQVLSIITLRQPLLHDLMGKMDA
jgi:hypothetical protein